MARDWRRVALAVGTAAALGSLFALDLEAQAAKPQPKKAKAAQPEAAADDDAGQKKTTAGKKQDPAAAQRAIDAATKLLQANKTEQAVQTLTATLNGGNLPPPIMAKALYTRGIAYRQQAKPAQAISDLTSALWLKGGLSEADRADALKQRAAAYSDAGLTEAGETVAAVVPPTKQQTPAPAKGWAAVTTSPSQTPAGGGWFESLFGASAAPPKADTPHVTASIEKAVPPQPASDRNALGPRVSKAWTSNTQVRTDASPAPAPPAPAAPKASGKFRVQLAAVRTREEARALAEKARREHAAALASREPEIDQAVLGNMGSFYRVRFGPYATMQETQTVCAKLKGSGLDCISVVQQ